MLPVTLVAMLVCCLKCNLQNWVALLSRPPAGSCSPILFCVSPLYSSQPLSYLVTPLSRETTYSDTHL